MAGGTQGFLYRYALLAVSCGSPQRQQHVQNLHDSVDAQGEAADGLCMLC